MYRVCTISIRESQYSASFAANCSYGLLYADIMSSCIRIAVTTSCDVPVPIPVPVLLFLLIPITLLFLLLLLLIFPPDLVPDIVTVLPPVPVPVPVPVSVSVSVSVFNP